MTAPSELTPLRAPAPGRPAREPAAHTGIAYRPALDGIRAVAVLAVIAYHFGAPLPGGFLGVDMFFVLSGYLITTLLLQERATTGRIALRAFWARRARRLLPPLFALMIVAAAVASQGPMASLANRRGDMVATLLYYANWHFISTRESYFATFVGASPMRHMWSLAVEEQFYLLWPLCVVGVLALARRRLVVLLGVVVLGAAASAWRARDLYDLADPSRAYLGTDARVHVLLVGCALAILVHLWPAITSAGLPRRAARVASLPIAAALVVALLVSADQSPKYYGVVSSLFATTVALLIWTIEVRPAGAAGRVLSWSPLRYVGRISYGLYLWHWPLLVWLVAEPDGTVGGSTPVLLLALAATFAAATVSFLLVERPVRGRGSWFARSSGRALTSAAIGLGLVTALAVQATAAPRGDAAAAAAPAPVDEQFGTCPEGSPGWCVRVQGDPGATRIASIGDSTALSLDAGFVTAAEANGWTYLRGGRFACSIVPLVIPAALEPDQVAIDNARNCQRTAQEHLEEMVARAEPDVWVVTDRIMLGPVVDGERLLRTGTPERRAQVVEALRRTLDRLTSRGAVVVLAGPAPPGEPVECAEPGATDAACTSEEYTVRHAPTREEQAIYAQVAAEMPGKVLHIAVDDLLCRGDLRCPALVDGVLARSDAVHYTAEFSRVLVPQILQRVASAGVALNPAPRQR